MGCTLSPIWTVFDGIRNLGSVLKYRPRTHDGGTRGGTVACVLWTLVGVYSLSSLTCAGKPSYEGIVRPVIRLRIWAKTRRIRQLVWCEWTQSAKERNLHRIRLLQNYPSCDSLSMDKDSPQHATKLAKYSGMSKQRCFFILLIGSSKSICRWLNFSVSAIQHLWQLPRCCGTSVTLLWDNRHAVMRQLSHNVDSNHKVLRAVACTSLGNCNGAVGYSRLWYGGCRQDWQKSLKRFILCWRIVTPRLTICTHKGCGMRIARIGLETKLKGKATKRR